MIHIACNIDDNYAMQCCTMLVSVMYNNQDEDICFHIISHDLSKDIKNKIQLHVGKFHQKVTFYNIPQKLYDSFPAIGNSHITIATYFRLFIGEILPDDIHKAIYLDCDLIVDGNLKDLWATNIDNHALAAVEDMWSGKDDCYKRLQYDRQYTYFNAGVLLLNLDYWRKNDLSRICASYMSEHKGELIFNDQDVLNAQLHNQKLLLPFYWNVQDGLLRRHKRIRPEMLSQVEKETRHPVIIHYTGHRKPWMHICLNPYRNLFFKYLDMTDWKGFRPHVPLSWKCKTILDTLLYTLRLKPKKYDTQLLDISE